MSYGTKTDEAYGDLLTLASTLTFITEYALLTAEVEAAGHKNAPAKYQTPELSTQAFLNKNQKNHKQVKSTLKQLIATCYLTMNEAFIEDVLFDIFTYCTKQDLTGRLLCCWTGNAGPTEEWCCLDIVGRPIANFDIDATNN